MEYMEGKHWEERLDKIERILIAIADKLGMIEKTEDTKKDTKEDKDK